MPRISAEEAGGQNVLAFLDLIAWSEIGPALLEASDNGYNVLVGSTPAKPLLFSSYAAHPNVYNKRCDSTAAGRYQLLSRYWRAYQSQLKLEDFSPINQDRIALKQIAERGALKLIQAGHIHAAIAKVSNIWASFPGAGYGQHEHEVKNLLAAYKAAYGSLAADEA